MMTILMRLLREPLLHFFAAGALIFFIYSNNGGSGESSPDVISISAIQIDRLTTQFSSVWRRPPTNDELDSLVDGYVREEVYYREALALGLDQNDAVVRQRMRQKIEFLTDTSAQMLEPTEDELQAFLTANEKKYRQGSLWALEQIFLGQTPTPDSISQ
ncbi:MAG: peptidyl-prolyl cis-trans isomerase, partial [Chloroflexi bacterium]|nr:peptidyl-prolyl cis-trans isomerase [Chloroflexota bacterium]